MYARTATLPPPLPPPPHPPPLPPPPVSRHPPTHYRTLSSSDTSALATLLSPHDPSQPHPALPPHLLLPSRTLASTLSTLCPHHSALNPLPLTTLLTALQHEVEVQIPRTWHPLLRQGRLQPVSAYEEMLGRVEGLQAIWLGGNEFERRFGRGADVNGTGGRKTKCAACCLCGIVADFKALVGVGVCLLARMGEVEEGRRRSRRFEWVVAALGTFGRDEEAKGRIWGMVETLAGEMREARSGRRGRERAGVEREQGGRQSQQRNQPFDEPRARHRARSVFTGSRSRGGGKDLSQGGPAGDPEIRQRHGRRVGFL
ncbi:hypothetical protein K431DRAFT_299239 [Polychaeton citri CBS 116435]|uniref:Uncharacterized protein n=1 Tax=Polychaeton citri CBS 116435 TaxID=1314669 RepID=A0A9P4URX6_9PEZI|nr:hypothetical protein K431DRAFT_299239 [Polychaeton citri CBS 116435]